MFGFMRSCYCNPEYSQVYCQTCRHLKMHYGLTALPFLSYEAVFLHALAVDLHWISTTHIQKCKPFSYLPIPSQEISYLSFLSRSKQENLTLTPSTKTSAKISTNKNPTSKTRQEYLVGEFSSAFTLLLMATKMEDDIRDENSLLARAILAFYRQSILKSRRYFRTLDPFFDEKINTFISQHINLESIPFREVSSEQITSLLQEYADPTAKTFAWIFQLFATQLGADQETADWISEIGFSVGAALLLADCAYDWEKDLRHEEFNPVHTLPMSAQAYTVSQIFLKRLHDLCISKFGNESLCAKIALGVHDRLFFIARQDSRYHKYLQTKPVLEMTHAAAACPAITLLAQTEVEPASCSQFVCYSCLCCTGTSLCFGICAPCREDDRIPTTAIDMCYTSALCVQCRECGEGTCCNHSK
ncbi:MAG: DUF5685 family protein [Planctomycetia bacterium]|nr:DUF5685 family protein [Planctomycetia bacterium]